MARIMRLAALGISHHSAPVEVRERLAVPNDQVPGLLQAMRAEGVGQEGVLLSTCNRVELYAVPLVGVDKLASWLASRAGISLRSVDAHLYRFREQEALRHVFRVASSLDSMVVGEPQIIGQFRDAYRIAQQTEAVGPVMHKVMDRALTVAKRVRNETDIAKEAVSVGRAGVELARQVLGGLEGRAALLVGAGAHGKLVARSLLGYGLGELMVTNRTFANAVSLAETFGGAAIPFEDFGRYLERVDVVIAATGAQRHLITRHDLTQIMRKRRYRSLVLMDLAVPRNIDPTVSELEGAYAFDVDDLVQIADRGMDHRRNAAQVAESIVTEEVEKAWRSLNAASINEAIGAISRHANLLREAELARNRVVFEGLDPAQRQAVEAMTRSLVKKLLHHPIDAVRGAGERGDHQGVAQLVGALIPPSDDETS